METLVFVYGTLKQGLYNHETYLKPAIALGKAEIVGAARTHKPEFHMVLDDQVFYPCLYQVDDSLYVRDDTDVDLLGGETVNCQVYLMPIIDDLPKLPRIADYTADMNAKYDAVMGDPQLEILECIYGKEVIHAVEAKLDEGMEFADAWKVVVKV
ncbi:hypothetical protein BBO99_00001117 [Phytophthora kernoviae]|uniref:Gamma-glutamylcyclotransferase AIG2-like domain-containing protein n=2 Tax=Phytophthora kernoviae TaxID=325452 RepID=A0A3R7K370_9STRA|nr:hypothetical protein G195_005080 [Phytophthora kernoviae 00238/432]KAG2529668.1 hypothetical protein JM18_001348 [Phytophthora kernoviae]KAG2531127.1 hypothetical protein JM16_001212 [Phytophthora kernoviae]RLN21202.1 hypothetical protein BBI17_004194 [Phytophthora kernoviae]RLN84650.1 hypothetical protein BBO99_00001117 [Phytophthora kernoviae]